MSIIGAGVDQPAVEVTDRAEQERLLLVEKALKLLQQKAPIKAAAPQRDPLAALRANKLKDKQKPGVENAPAKAPKAAVNPEEELQKKLQKRNPQVKIDNAPAIKKVPAPAPAIKKVPALKKAAPVVIAKKPASPLAVRKPAAVPAAPTPLKIEPVVSPQVAPNSLNDLYQEIDHLGHIAEVLNTIKQIIATYAQFNEAGVNIVLDLDVSLPLTQAMADLRKLINDPEGLMVLERLLTPFKDAISKIEVFTQANTDQPVELPFETIQKLLDTGITELQAMVEGALFLTVQEIQDIKNKKEAVVVKPAVVAKGLLVAEPPTVAFEQQIPAQKALIIPRKKPVEKPKQVEKPEQGEKAKLVAKPEILDRPAAPILHNLKRPKIAVLRKPGARKEFDQNKKVLPIAP